MRPNRPRSWTFWTHKTQQSVPKWYHELTSPEEVEALRDSLLRLLAELRRD